VPRINWSSMLSVGVPEIDRQHQVLVGLINQLNDATDDSGVQVDINAILHELVRYTEYHFSFEEDLMREKDYGEFDEHLREHRMFIEKVKQLVERWGRGEAIQVAEVLRFLRDWLVSHILHIDRKLGDALNSAPGT
jgi:hemerythrin